MKSKITLLALALVLVYSCKAKKEVTADKLVNPTNEKVAFAPILEHKSEVLSPVAENPEMIKLAATYDGGMLYGNNCAKCHKLYKSEDFSKEEWVPILKDMQKKARITDAETLAIYNYLTTK